MKSILASVIYFIFSPFFRKKMNSDYVYLTFDDGPYGKNTLDIFNCLNSHQVKATFFMLGSSMEKHPNIVRKIKENGHSIGFHSYEHISLKKLSMKSIINDVKQMNRLSKRFNYPLVLYRPPYGDLTLFAFVYFILKGKKIILWSLDSRDSFEPFENIKKIVSPENVQKGDILLFHDDYDNAEILIDSTIQRFKEFDIECRAL